MPMCTLDQLLPPAAARDTSYQLSGLQRVKAIDALPGPSRELVQHGRLCDATFTVPPCTRQQLLDEQTCLRRELAGTQRRLTQIETELLNAL